MKKLLNKLFPIKSESKEDEAKRMAEINSAFDELQDIKAEIEKKEKQLAAINKYLNELPY